MLPPRRRQVNAGWRPSCPVYLRSESLYVGWAMPANCKMLRWAIPSTLDQRTACQGDWNHHAVAALVLFG
jgi:hypothetical protein